MNQLSFLWTEILYNPTLNLYLIIYKLSGENTLITIFIFALIFKILTYPLTVRQLKMTQILKDLKPKVDALKEKYANEQEKFMQEQMKLYSESGYSPVGCVVNFLPQIIIFSLLFSIIRNLGAENLNGLYEPVRDFVFGINEAKVDLYYFGINLGSNFNALVDACNCSPQITTPLVGALIQPFADIFYAIKGSVGVYQTAVYIGTAILAGISQYYSGQMMAAQQLPPKKPLAEMTQEEMTLYVNQYTMKILILLTITISMSNALLLSIYWIIQSVFSIISTKYINRVR